MIEAGYAGRAALWASVCAAAMIAQQIGAKAVRDAIFLSYYGVERWPAMLMVAAVISIVTVFVSSGILARRGPGSLVPWTFAVSSLLTLAEWWLLTTTPAVAAVMLVLHVAVLGSVLISGFWSLINERFDPRTARKRIGRIVAFGTLGGLVGGVLAERVTAYTSVAMVLPALAVLHGVCAWAALRFRAVTPEPESGPETEIGSGFPARLGMRVLGRSAHLRNMAYLVLVVTVAATLVDFVFRSEVTTMCGDDGDRLAQFFATFYAATGLAVFVVQSVLGRIALVQAGLGWTLSFLPMIVGLGSAVSLIVPGAWPVILARGGESVGRNSLFRSAYELLYIPVPLRDKRAAKAIVDVGVERAGDVVGAALVAGVLLWAPGSSRPVQLVLAGVLSVVALWICRRLQQGYIRSLEANLRHAADTKDLPAVLETGFLPRPESGGAAVETAFLQQSFSDMSTMILWEPGGGPAAEPEIETEAEPELDPVSRDVAALESGDFRRIVSTLGRGVQPDPALVPRLINLLAWEEVYPFALPALKESATRDAEPLLRALLDRDQDFAVRRRLPRIVAEVPSQDVADGLIRALGDRRFEVRYQAGSALSRIRHGQDIKGLHFDSDRILASVLNEVKVDAHVWSSHQLLDEPDPDTDDLYDEFLRYRTSRSLEHVFRLLSLILPPKPVRIAFRALNTDDVNLRGTALEYLEGVLPAEVKMGLWPFLEDHRSADHPLKPRDKALEELLRSQVSVNLNLSMIRGAVKPEDEGS